MITSRFIDETFDTKNCQNYILSILCSQNGFSFLVFDPVANKFIALIEQKLITATPFELKNEMDHLFKNEPLLNHQFKKVKATFLNQRSVLIPEPIIGETEWNDLFYLTFNKQKDEQVLRNVVVPNTTSILFSVPGAIFRSIINQFPNTDFFAAPLPLINYGLKQNKSQYLIFIFGDLLIICFIADRKIHFLNHFYTRNDTDCIYYILSVAKQLNFGNKAELKLIGKIEKNSEMVVSLKKYFEKVDFAQPSSHFTVSKSFPDTPEHFRLTLFELALCE